MGVHWETLAVCFKRRWLSIQWLNSLWLLQIRWASGALQPQEFILDTSTNIKRCVNSSSSCLLGCGTFRWEENVFRQFRTIAFLTTFCQSDIDEFLLWCRGIWAIIAVFLGYCLLQAPSTWVIQHWPNLTYIDKCRSCNFLKSKPCCLKTVCEKFHCFCKQHLNHSKQWSVWEVHFLDVGLPILQDFDKASPCCLALRPRGGSTIFDPPCFPPLSGNQKSQ